MSEDVIIPALGALDSYKYLGLLEHDTINDSQIKTIIVVKQCRQRAKKVLKINVITAIISWAIPLVHYTAGIVCWTQNELKTLDISRLES